MQRKQARTSCGNRRCDESAPRSPQEWRQGALISGSLETITRFFNDLIGTFIPGLVLVCGLFIMHIGLRANLEGALPKLDGLSISLFVALVYAIGHIVLALYSNLIHKPLQKIGVLRTDQTDALVKRKSYSVFQMLVAKKIEGLDLEQGAQGGTGLSKDWGYNDLRSLALSMSSEASSLGRRFMFISLLCNGVGTALVIMLLDFMSCELIAPQLLFQYSQALPVIVQILLLAAGIYSLYRQGEAFYSRAMSTPFPVAVSLFLIK